MIFEAFAVVSDENEADSLSQQTTQPKLMGEGNFFLSEKFDQLMSEAKITELITIEGLLKINENGSEKMKQIPVGQASVVIYFENITISRSRDSTPSHRSRTSERSHQHSHKSNLNSGSSHQSNGPSNYPSMRDIKSSDLIWRSLQYAHSMIIQIQCVEFDFDSRSNNKWSQCFLSVQCTSCGKTVTRVYTKSIGNTSLSFNEKLELLFDKSHMYETDTLVFKLIDNESKKCIATFTLPMEDLCVTSQYNVKIPSSSTDQTDTDCMLHCCISFEPGAKSMATIFSQSEQPSDQALMLIDIKLIDFIEEQTHSNPKICSCMVHFDSFQKSSVANQIPQITYTSPSWKSSALDKSLYYQRGWFNFVCSKTDNLESVTLFCKQKDVLSNNHLLNFAIYDAHNNSVNRTLIATGSLPVNDTSSNASSQTLNVKANLGNAQEFVIILHKVHNNSDSQHVSSLNQLQRIKVRIQTWNLELWNNFMNLSMSRQNEPDLSTILHNSLNPKQTIGINSLTPSIISNSNLYDDQTNNPSEIVDTIRNQMLTIEKSLFDNNSSTTKQIKKSNSGLVQRISTPNDNEAISDSRIQNTQRHRNLQSTLLSTKNNAIDTNGEILQQNYAVLKSAESELLSGKKQVLSMKHQWQKSTNDCKILAVEVHRLRQEIDKSKFMNNKLLNRLKEYIANDGKILKNMTGVSSQKLSQMLLRYAKGHKLSRLNHVSLFDCCENICTVTQKLQAREK